MSDARKPSMRKLTPAEALAFWERVKADPVMSQQLRDSRLTETNFARMREYMDTIARQARHSLAERRMNEHVSRPTIKPARRPPHRKP